MARISPEAAYDMAVALDIRMNAIARGDVQVELGEEPLPRRLTPAFIEERYLNAGFDTEGLEPSRCVLVIAQLLVNVKWYRWPRLFKPDFVPYHWSLANEYYWGVKYEENPDWVIWYNGRKQVNENMTAEEAFLDTARIIRRYFLDKMASKITAALLVKLYAAKFIKYANYSLLFNEMNWGDNAKDVILGRHHIVWLQRLILPRELLAYYRYAIEATPDIFQ